MQYPKLTELIKWYDYCIYILDNAHMPKDYYNMALCNFNAIFKSNKMNCQYGEFLEFETRLSPDEDSEEFERHIFCDKGMIYKPIARLDYRGETAYIYNDDYGQQIFMIYNDNEYSGGSYNMDYLFEFTQIMDNEVHRRYMRR